MPAALRHDDDRTNAVTALTQLFGDQAPSQSTTRLIARAAVRPPFIVPVVEGREPKEQQPNVSIRRGNWELRLIIPKLALIDLFWDFGSKSISEDSHLFELETLTPKDQLDIESFLRQLNATVE